jgi:hypothetical protein
MSESWSETLQTLRRWRQTRLPHALFVPAAAVMVLASATGQDTARTEILGRLVVAWVTVALLRLWDDLEDREVDRRAHADRVWLGAAGRIGLLVAAGLSAVALWAPVGFVALYASLFAFYRARRSPLEAVLLLKYPLLVGLLRGPVDGEGGAAMLLVYGGMLLDAGYRAPGALACWLATLLLACSAPLPGAALLCMGLVVPWVRPILGRAGVLATIAVELLAFRLVTS